MADDVSLINSFTSFFDKKDGITLPTSDSLLTGQQEPDDPFAQRQRDMSEYYQSLAGQNISRSDMLPPKSPDMNPLVDVPNILFGDVMAAFGTTLDKEGLHYDLQTAKNFWAEHPVRAGTAVALNVLPGLALATKAHRASKFANVSDDVIRATGLVDEAVDLAKLGAKEKKLMRQQAYQITRDRELAQKIEAGTATRMDQVVNNLNKSIGNTYMEQMAMGESGEGAIGLTKAYSQRMQQIVNGETVSDLMNKLPDDKFGTPLAKYFNDPRELNNLPKEVQPWAMAFREQATRVQQQGLKDGFITQETADRVGDVWFPTLRKGSELTDEGVTTSIFTVAKKGEKGKAKMIAVPRTTSNNLLERTTTKEDLGGLLNRQEIAEALDRGDATQALKLVKKEKSPELIRAVEAGDTETALGIIGQGNFIDTVPQTLTVKGLMQQSMLQENFRFLRDVSMNSKYSKTPQEYAALSKSVQQKMRSLDELPNSSILRRMVGKSKGLNGAVDRLGYVHEDVFRELTSASTGQPAVAGGLVGFLDVLTAVHKTARTAGNPFSHGQNLWGNYGFLAMAGWNPFTKQNHDLIWKKALPAIWQLQRAARKGKGGDSITEVNFGSVASMVGGPDIDVAAELARAEVGNLIEKSSLLASEGIGTLHNLGQRADDSQTLLKSFVKSINKVVDAIPPINVTIDAYMAEDSIVKFGYYLGLRAKGLSPTGAALEVSRRLPMYSTIGHAQKVLRKTALPWVSFPSEALRVVKNNVMDYPLRSAMWFHGVDAFQAMMYPAIGETSKGLNMIKEGLPTYGQKPSTTLLTPLRDQNGDLRAATLDFLPWSSFLPQSSAAEASMREILPFGAGQPMPILDGIFQAMTGQDQFGKPIPTEPGSITEKMKVMALGTMGVIAPPMVQKYMLSTTAPDTTYRLYQDLGKARNPYTTKPGDAIYDMLLNNIGSLGTSKFYASSPEQRLANMNMTDRAVNDWRAKLTRDWGAYMRSGDWQNANEVFADISRSFNLEWKNPAIAQQKQTDWQLRHLKTLMKHPQLGAYSKEKLIEIFRQQGDEIAGVRSQAYDQMVESIRREMGNRGKQKPAADGGEDPYQ